MPPGAKVENVARATTIAEVVAVSTLLAQRLRAGGGCAGRKAAEYGGERLELGFAQLIEETRLDGGEVACLCGSHEVQARLRDVRFNCAGVEHRVLALDQLA